MTKSEKSRLDHLLVEMNLAESGAKARALIMAGAVEVDGRVVDKPGVKVKTDAAINVKEGQKYTSRGGLKLEAALDEFKIDPAGRICLDVGASTGGFTDCLLQRGAQKVYAVDVGKGQLDWRLRNHEKVVVMEGVNARHLESADVPEPIGLCVIDVSFISLTLILPAVVPLLDAGADLICLVKPQFEAGKDQVGKGGVVKDPEVIKECVEKIARCARDLGLIETGRLPSPIKGPKGNQEQLLWLKAAS